MTTALEQTIFTPHLLQYDMIAQEHVIFNRHPLHYKMIATEKATLIITPYTM